MGTSNDLQRFVDAQQYSYDQALQEVKNGLKQSHWVWYIFPQLKGFGHSYNSEYYGIRDLDEARAYYSHPVLGGRLLEITEALLAHAGKSAEAILSPIDARKVKSCMTLFWLASENPLFKTVIDTFYRGEMDRKTLQRCETAVEPLSKETPVIEINTEIMVEINNLCHFNESRKAARLIKYMIPQWYVESKHEDNCIYFRSISLYRSPDPYNEAVYKGLPQEMALFCWKAEGILHSICYVSVEEGVDFLKAFHLDFEGMDGQDCDRDELGWYYYMDKAINIENIVNYSGSEYIPVFRIVGEAVECCNPPVIRHKYRLRVPNKSDGDYESLQKYYDLALSGNWNAKRALDRGGFNLYE